MTVPAIVVTPGASNANSYITVAEGDTYASGDIDGSAWTGASADDKVKALISATRQIDVIGYVGERTSATQALAWPRTGFTTTEKQYGSNEIPAEIKLSTYEVAKSLLRGTSVINGGSGTELIPGIPNDGLKRVKLDVMEVEWQSTYRAPVTPLKALPQLQLLLNELVLNTPGQAIAVVRS